MRPASCRSGSGSTCRSGSIREGVSIQFAISLTSARTSVGPCFCSIMAIRLAMVTAFCHLMAHAAARADGVVWEGVPHKPSAYDLEGRAAWAKQNIDRLRRIGEDIIAANDLKSDDLPSDDDDRYQFAAACVKIAQAYGNPV